MFARLPTLPTSFAALYSDLGFAISALVALPYEELWEQNPQQNRESLVNLTERLLFMLIDVRYVGEPAPGILHQFAAELAKRTPKPSATSMRNGEHQTYAVRHLHSQLDYLLGLERQWTLRQPHVQDMINELVLGEGARKGRLVAVRRAIHRYA
ncbi:MAG TPA: hypothetical protein VGH44_05820 [Candidatus Saccharimonadia bacterium]|jgi:hypothetical protein